MIMPVKPYFYLLYTLLALALFCTISAAVIPDDHLLPSDSQQIPDRPKLHQHHKRYENTDEPTPFDTSLGQNFTSKACPNFITSHLSSTTSSTSPAYQNCHPLSLLLRDSNSFFSNTLRSAPETSHFLDTACEASATSCARKLRELAGELVRKEHCGEDYEKGNPVVVDAYVDLVAYEAVYRASCLKDPGPGNGTSNQTEAGAAVATQSDNGGGGGYCFVNAVTNSTKPADYDIYFIPLGAALSDDDNVGYGNSIPPKDEYITCNACLRASMEIYADYARRDGQPLVGSYVPSARVVDRHCGRGFANVNVTVGAVKDAAVSRGAVTTGGDGGLVGVVLVWGLVTLLM